MYELAPNIEIDGKYILKEELGAGSFGVVWKAQHKSLTHKSVAIKFGLNLMGDARGRFTNEIQILDQLRDNPYIIKAEDTGNYGPFPYLILEFAAGGDLDSYITSHPPTLVAIASWLQQLASALDYAHSKGIVHRDLKPANILFMQDGSLRLCDFGIAHDANHNMTGSGYALGTLEYMAPEQIRSFKGVGPQTDIWALAVITLKLITGQTLFDAKAICTSLFEVYEDVSNATLPTLTVDRTWTAIPSSVPQVLERALEKDSQKRLYNYPTVAKFAEAFALALISLPVNSTIPNNSVTPNPPPASVVTPPYQTSPTLPTVNSRLLVTLTGHTGIVWGVAWSPDGKTLASGSGDNTVRLWLDGWALSVLKGHTDIVWGVAWSPDGKILASASADHTVRLWSVDGQVLPTLLGHTGIVESVAWSPNGRILASASADKTIRLWSSAGHALDTLIGHSRPIERIVWSPDGKLLASASWDSTVRLWLADGTSLATLLGHTNFVMRVAWSPDGKILASASQDHTVRLWSADGQALAILTDHTNFVMRVAWSPDGKILASASQDHTVRLWSADGQALATLTGHVRPVEGLEWSPDGKILASASQDHTVRLWSADGQALAILIGHNDYVVSVAWSPDGKVLASASGDKTIKLWAINN
jgi:WD40 repeat protein